MDELRAKYEKQLEEYNTLVEQTLNRGDVSQVEKLRAMNTALSKTLNDMIEKATFLKKDTPNLKRERDELVERLRQIQKEYNGLLVNTDTLETLRRIRQQESSEANRQLYLYLFFFLILSMGIFVYLLFMTQRKDTTAPMASMPPTTAALV
jgi:small-conductance mechanosensitive channel